jgi:multiple sugar transport system permease protein
MRRLVGGGGWNRQAYTLAAYLVLIPFLVFNLFPFVWIAITSIKPNQDLYDTTQSPFALSRITLEHYQFLFTKIAFPVWLRNSVVVSLAATGISLVVGILSGYSLARLRFRGSTWMATGIFVTYLVPPALMFIPLAHVVRALGLGNSLLALIVTYPTFLVPFCSWMLMGYFRTIPKEIEECAMMDGCGRLQTLIRIVLPVSVPGLLSAGIFAFTLSWNEFLYALVFIQSEARKTVPVGVVGQLVLGDVFFWGPLMAAALLGSLPVVMVYMFFQRYFVAGLTAGAVKG